MATVEKEVMVVGNRLKPIENPTFNLPVLVNPQETMEIVALNLEGCETRFDRVKIPSGGGLAFEIPGDGEESEVAKEIIGIVLDHYPVNAYWQDKFSGQNNAPDCSSMDAKTGTGDPGGNCKTCSLNQYGSGVDEQGNTTRGKACKNIHRVYILREEEAFPILLSLPPSSLTELGDYMKRISNKKPVKYYECITKVKLQKAKNNKGIEFSKATFSRLANLSPEEKVAILAYADTLRNAMREENVDAVEYNTGDGSISNNSYAAAGADEEEVF